MGHYPTHLTMPSFRSPAVFLARLLCVALAACALYILTAPPLMMAMTRNAPREWPGLYRPLIPGFQCQWTAPFFNWYFDRVWGADTEIRGE